MGYHHPGAAQAGPIDMGLKSSGTRQTALALFNVLGAKEQDLDLKSVANLSEALCNKQIDAYGLVMGHPNRIVLDTAKRCAVRFLAIEGPVRGPAAQRGQGITSAARCRHASTRATSTAPPSPSPPPW